LDVQPFAIASGVSLAAALGIASLRPRWIVAGAPWVLAIVAALTATAVALIVEVNPFRLSIALDPSSEPLIPRSDPSREAYSRATRFFGTDDVYVVALETDDIFERESLLALQRITNDIRRLAGVRSAQSLADVLSFRYVPDDDYVDVSRFIVKVPEDPAALAELRRRALADPLYRKTILSTDGRTAAINVSFHPMTDGEFLERDLDGQIAAILARETGDGRRVFVSGRPHVRAVAHHLMVDDLQRLLPLSMLLAAIVVFVLTGSMRSVVVPLSSCLLSALWTFGAMALLGIDINVITLVLAPTLVCVGSVYGVHVIARYEQIAASAPNSRVAATRCLEYSRIPVLMAGFTTCVGFGALLLADIPATNEFGGFAIFGVAAVTLLSLTYVPAVLGLLPIESGSGDGGPLYARRTRISAAFGAALDRSQRSLGRVAVEHPTRALVIWAALTLSALALIPRIVIDTDFMRFFDEKSQVRTDFDAVNRLLAGTIPIYVTLEGPAEGAFREPAALRAVAQLQRRIAEISGVSNVLSAVDLIRVANVALSEGDPEASRIPDSRAGVAEIVFMIPKANLRRFATSNHSKANIIVRTGQLGSAAMREIEARIREAIDQVRLPNGIRADVVSNATLLSHSADGIARNQVMQVGFAAVTILLLVCVVFRSVSVGLISMLPNIVPVLLYFGVLGTGITTLSLPTSLIGCIALGIAIDDTVHFLVAYRRERERCAAAAAVERVIVTVGRPIVITSVTLVIGFLALLLSGFATLREFGALTALTMAICLTTDLILLPALLARARA
jgi:hydrophobe/amphiphile efflux-3 (HAE3) family protein